MVNERRLIQNERRYDHSKKKTNEDYDMDENILLINEIWVEMCENEHGKYEYNIQ